MKENEYLQCLNFGVLIDESVHNQTIPIVLAIDDQNKQRIEGQKSVSLIYKNNLIAILEDIEIFPHRKEERAASVFKTINRGHPSIKMIYDSGDWLVGGDLKVFAPIKWNDGLDDYRLTPNQIRNKLKEMNVRIGLSFEIISHLFDYRRTQSLLSNCGTPYTTDTPYLCRTQNDNSSKENIKILSFCCTHWAVGLKTMTSLSMYALDNTKPFWRRESLIPTLH